MTRFHFPTETLQLAPLSLKGWPDGLAAFNHYNGQSCVLDPALQPLLQLLQQLQSESERASHSELSEHLIQPSLAAQTSFALSSRQQQRICQQLQLSQQQLSHWLEALWQQEILIPITASQRLHPADRQPDLERC